MARFPLTSIALGLAGLLSASAAIGAPTHTVDHLSIYPAGAAVITDAKSVELETGANHIEWSIPAKIALGTFWLSGDAVELEQVTAQAQPAASSDPLERRVGESVALVYLPRDDDEPSTTTEKHGVLTAVAGDIAYVAANGQIFRITPDSPWAIRWPASEKPQQNSEAAVLNLLVNAEHAGDATLQATYQTQGLNWHAATTGEYNQARNQLVFHSIAIIENTSESPIRARQASLIAGQTNRAGHRRGPVALASARQFNASAASESAPQPVGHGYRYAIEDGLALAADQTTAFTIIDRTEVQATRTFVFENAFRVQYRGADRRHARVTLTFDNPDKAPLPAGTFRVYSARKPATLLGADRVGNTPPGATVTLQLGRAFDVTGSRQITAGTTKEDTYKRTIVVKLHNAGDTPARVELREHLPDDAQIVSASQPVDRQTVGRALWQVRVKPHSDAAIHYTVRWPKES